MKTEQEIREKLKETFDAYNNDLHDGDLTRTRHLRYKYIMEALKWVLDEIEEQQ